MPKFLLLVHYTKEGVQGLLKDGGTERVERSTEAVKAVGGTIEAFYYTFGEWDAALIIDVPDNASAVALSMTVAATGTVRSQAIPLLTPAEIDTAAKMNIPFHPPGQG